MNSPRLFQRIIHRPEVDGTYFSFDLMGAVEFKIEAPLAIDRMIGGHNVEDVVEIDNHVLYFLGPLEHLEFATIFLWDRYRFHLSRIIAHQCWLTRQKRLPVVASKYTPKDPDMLEVALGLDRDPNFESNIIGWMMLDLDRPWAVFLNENAREHWAELLKNPCNFKTDLSLGIRLQ